MCPRCFFIHTYIVLPSNSPAVAEELISNPGLNYQNFLQGNFEVRDLSYSDNLITRLSRCSNLSRDEVLREGTLRG